MKKLLTLFLLANLSIASAQWSNTSNQFYDSLHMPVSTALSGQRNPLVINSYPDGGYFVIWEDDRNYATTKTDIYAQKYDQAGNRLWADNGVPVANGPNTQRYTFGSIQDYRNRSFAATDSAGGFYICYIDDSINNYSWERIAAQHVKNNGSAVFGNVGYIIAQTPGGLNFTLAAPLLIADGNKGFFIAYKSVQGNDYINVYDYRDENGTMQLYGGGKVNENAIQTSSLAPCGIRTDVIYPGTNVQDYNIWPDGQGGCNIIMALNGNTGTQGRMLAYNRLWRAKKNSKVRTLFRNESGVACPKYTDYIKGEVYLLYSLHRDFMNVACGGGTGPLYQYTNYRLLSNGYQVIDEGGYDYSFPKGTTIATNGNINVDLMAVTRRSYIGNVVSDFTVQGYAYKSEKYDSVPFQRTTYGNPEIGFNPVSPSGLDNLDFFRDTLLATSNYYPDFSLAGGGEHIYSAALMSTGGDRFVRLQHLTIIKKSTDRFALEYQTGNKNGTAIGRESNTGFGSNSISYDFPLVKVNANGTALFYIREYYRSARVSPITGGAELAWGAMGVPVGTGVFNNSFYNFEQPVVALDDLTGTGLITWRDNRSLPGITGENISMRHLGSLDVFNYIPPVKRVRPLTYFSTIAAANPAIFLGTSKQYSTLEVYNSYFTVAATSPVVSILDNYNMGKVQVNVFQQIGTIRKYNGRPYLNRNFTIKVDNDPVSSDPDILLYFSNEEFKALKAADPTILDLSFLSVIRQPNTTANPPATYTPVAGEEVLTPITSDSVAGGYLLKVIAKGFGNFFIQKITALNLCNAASGSIISDVTGGTYQWQVNTGSNFFNITNNSNYVGTNTATLQLNNVPSSFNGYRYRCVIDGTKVSSAVYLQIANSWTGAVSTAWENPLNWSCSQLPDANTDVIINSGAVILNSNASCKSIKVNPGATLTVKPGFNLTVTN